MIEKSYMDIAIEDYETALDLRTLNRLNPCVKYIQQFVGKSLKHIVCLNGDPNDERLLGSHNVPVIAKRVEQILAVKYSKEDKQWFSILKGLYFNTSYPGDNYEEVDEERVDDALIWVKGFRVLIGQHQQKQQLQK